MASSLDIQSPGPSDSLAQSTTPGSNLELLPSLSPTEFAQTSSSVVELTFSTPPSSPTRYKDTDSLKSESSKNLSNVSPKSQPKEPVKIVPYLNCNLRILHISGMPIACNYEAISMGFDEYGKISEIRMDLKKEMLE